ncbi:Hypothetical predicted protein [Olea europaea subsp. europaea]|uniref:Uncharacterized protein n=1 Tax=Olea europaea subsp. europaea TaxID=158383 RepID=A0A8S0PN56_OLEEU|nr:Hypothetical predicted protein [Olea europaea subsp. europaea]
MNWWKPKQSPSSSEPPRHGGLFHNLQSQFSNFLQMPQNLFFNGCRATAQTPNITPDEAWDALKQLFYPRYVVYNTRMYLRDLKYKRTIKDYVMVATMIMLQIHILSDDDLLKLAYELQYWTKQELNRYNHHRKKNLAMSEEEIGERLCRVPVYNIKFSEYEAAQMASLTNRRKTILGYFLGKADAKAYAEHGLVVSVPPRIPYVDSERLDVVMDYNMVLGPLKLIPEATEVKNALEVKKKNGLPCENFSGIPVFESKNLSLCQDCYITNEGFSDGRRLVFFKKEDLEKSLAKARVASHDGVSNFANAETHIEVAALEDIIKAMKDNSTSEWNSVYFAYPGEDFTTLSLVQSYEDILREMDNFK